MSVSNRRESFSPVDAAWLRMDTPTNMAMITGVMMFSERLDIWRLKEVVEHRLLQHERFRQRVRQSLLGLRRPSWEIDPHFDLNAHIRHIALPEPGDVSTLQSLVGDLMGTPLDPTKPLWQLHVVDNFNGGSALVCRLHHCIADGLALVQVLLATADLDPDAPLLAAEDEVRRHDGLLNRLLKPIASTVSWTTRGAELLLREGLEAVVDPSRLLTPAKLAADSMAALGKLVFMLPDRRTILRGQCGVAKRAVWTAPVPVAEVKAIGNGLGCTINDVLLAAVSGALGRYLEGVWSGNRWAGHSDHGAGEPAPPGGGERTGEPLWAGDRVAASRRARPAGTDGRAQAAHGHDQEHAGGRRGLRASEHHGPDPHPGGKDSSWTFSPPRCRP